MNLTLGSPAFRHLSNYQALTSYLACEWAGSLLIVLSILDRPKKWIEGQIDENPVLRRSIYLSRKECLELAEPHLQLFNLPTPKISCSAGLPLQHVYRDRFPGASSRYFQPSPFHRFSPPHKRHLSVLSSDTNKKRRPFSNNCFGIRGVQPAEAYPSNSHVRHPSTFDDRISSLKLPTLSRIILTVLTLHLLAGNL